MGSNACQERPGSKNLVRWAPKVHEGKGEKRQWEPTCDSCLGSSLV
jgi:hypothetical protein